MHGALAGAKARIAARTIDKRKDTGPARATLHTAYQRFREVIGPVADQVYRYHYEQELSGIKSRYSDPKHYPPGFNPSDLAHQADSVLRIKRMFYRGALDQVHIGLADDAQSQLDALRQELARIGPENLPPAKRKLVLEPPKGPQLVDLADRSKHGTPIGTH